MYAALSIFPDMKTKRIISFIAALIICAALSSPAFAVVSKSDSFYAADYANVLSSATEDMIINYNGALEQQCQGAQIVVVTVDYLDGMYCDEYAYQLFNDWGVGSSEYNNGMLLLLAVQENKAWLAYGLGLNSKLDTNDVDNMLDKYFWDDFDAGKYDAAVTTLFKALLNWYDEEYGSSTASSGTRNSPAQSNYQNSYSNNTGHYYNNYGGYGFVQVIRSIIKTGIIIVIIIAIFGGNRRGGRGGGGGGGRKPTVTIPDDVPTGLNGDDHFAYIVGYPDGNVKPGGNITRAEVATIFFRLLTEDVRTANSTQANSLSDVSRGQWFNHAISTLSSMGIVKGNPDGTFDPDAPITRAEFAAIAARFDDKNTNNTSNFSDIASHWAKDEIGVAANKGWINGYPDSTFRPDQYITRAEAMTLVNRVLNRLPEKSEDLLDDMIKWPDNADASVWYYLAVQEATNSHDYSDKSDADKYEKWTKLRENRDWTELEK